SVTRRGGAATAGGAVAPIVSAHAAASIVPISRRPRPAIDVPAAFSTRSPVCGSCPRACDTVRRLDTRMTTGTWGVFERLRGGIGPRLLGRVLLFSFAITQIVTLVQLGFDYRRDLKAIDGRLSEVAASYSQSLGEGLWNLDRRQLELQIGGIL